MVVRIVFRVAIVVVRVFKVLVRIWILVRAFRILVKILSVLTITVRITVRFCGPGWPSGLSSEFWQDFQDFSPGSRRPFRIISGQVRITRKESGLCTRRSDYSRLY